jgi:hypothetical protein
MSGVDMLVKSLMQSLGVDPEKVKAEIQQYGQQLAGKISSMDGSLAEIKAQQGAMYEMLVSLALKNRPDTPAEKSAEIAASNGGGRAR